MKLLISTAAIAAFSFASMASAQSNFNGSLSFSGLSSQMYSSDDDDEWNSFAGASLAGNVATSVGGFELSADFSYLWRDLSPYGDPETEWEDQGPREYSVVGLHAGKMFDDKYFGVFGGVGFQQSDDDDQLKSGHFYGIEGKMPVGETTVFAQIGYMDWNYDDTDTPDNSFIGMIYRAGVSFDVTDRVSAMIDLEYGMSPDGFEDSGSSNWGSFLMTELQASYAINDHFDATVGYEYGIFIANDEDMGMESNLSIGVQYNFGGSNGFNELSSPTQGFAAAGWASTLD